MRDSTVLGDIFKNNIFKYTPYNVTLFLFQSLIPKLIDLVNDRINRQLSFGYDIGKGFVVAEEEVMKMVDQLVLDQKIMQDLKMRSEKNRLDIIRSLGTYYFAIFAFSILWLTSNTIF